MEYKKLMLIPENALSQQGRFVFITRKDKWRNRVCFCGSKLKFKNCCYSITRDAQLVVPYDKSTWFVLLAKIVNWLKISNIKKGN